MSNISPIILIMAMLLDIFGFICLILTFTMGVEIGETLSFVPDILGLIFIGGGEIFLKHRKAISKAGKARAKAIIKAKGKHGLKFFLAFFGELLPLIGAFPFWTIYVLSEAKKKEVPAYA